MKELIQRLLAQRAQLVEGMEKRTAAAVTASRDLTEEERQAHTTDRAEVAKLDERLVELDDEEKRNAAAADLVARYQNTPDRPEGGAVVTDEPLTYRKGGPNSYFKDLVAGTLDLRGLGVDGEARTRLHRHGHEIGVLKREEHRRPDAERRALSRVDGSGGYAVPPLWMMDEFIGIARAGRPFANACRVMDLPAGTDSINIPKLSTGTATAAQVGDNQSVQSTDATDTSIGAPVVTVAGQQDLALQLIEQSPLNYDEIIIADLADDLATKVDNYSLNGTGSSGQPKGVLATSVIPSGHAVAFTTGSPTVQLLWPKLNNAIALVTQDRKKPPTAIWMSPLRWAWIASALDGNQRPLVTPLAGGGTGFNALGAYNEYATDGPVGVIAGLPVYIDQNLPTNLGVGTNQDLIVIARMPDLYLWEGSLRSRALEQPLSATLGVRLQVWEYMGFQAERYNNALASVGGTGLTAPTF